MLGKGCVTRKKSDERPFFFESWILSEYIYICNMYIYIHCFVLGTYYIFLMTLLTVTLRSLDLPMNGCLG